MLKVTADIFHLLNKFFNPPTPSIHSKLIIFSGLLFITNKNSFNYSDFYHWQTPPDDTKRWVAHNIMAILF